MTDAEVCDFLRRCGVDFARADHPPVYTCEQAAALVPPLPGLHIKNLFTRDGKGRRHFLLVVGAETRVDLKALAPHLGVGKLGMASPERLHQLLGVEPGAVTLLGLVHAQPGAVEVVIDRSVWDADQPLHCHPLVNTATLAIPRSGVERFLQALGCQARIVDIPARA